MKENAVKKLDDKEQKESHRTTNKKNRTVQRNLALIEDGCLQGRLSVSIKLHGTTSQMRDIFIIVAVRTSNLTFVQIKTQRKRNAEDGKQQDNIFLGIKTIMEVRAQRT